MRAVGQLEQQLRQSIARHGSGVVALSGGVDSTVIAALCAQELGERALAITGVSESLPSAELAPIETWCARVDLAHERIDTQELDRAAYVENSPERCFHCKSELYGALRTRANERGLSAVFDGTTFDDQFVHRPGLRAARRFGIVSPFVEVEAGKDDVRAIAQRLGLPNAERPSSPCLSSRIAYGVPVTPERLGRVERSEAFLKGLGFSNVRVRLHDQIARIEVPKDQLSLALGQADVIEAALRAEGFTYVTLDLRGLRSGSLLEVFQTRGPHAS